MTFAQLLDAVASIDGEFRLRFMTSHPKDATHKLIDTIAAHPEHLAPHLHLPVQSGSDRILKEMNRRYTREQYLELIGYAREKLPGVTFSSDIIVGFPGETEEDFKESYDFAEEIGFAKIHVFPYSPKKGTPAAERKDQLPNVVKSERSHTLIELSDNMAQDFLQPYIGQEVEVLFERAVSEGVYEGHTTNYIKVQATADSDLTNQICKAYITKAEQEELCGEVRA